MAATPDTADPMALDPHALRERLARGEQVKLIDVRSPAEFESAHIPDSYNVPLDALDAHRAALRRLREPAVLICRSGNRAAQAERKLVEAGLANVQVLAGGLEAWRASGAELRYGRQRWDLERQVRLVAGSLVLASVLASTVFKPAKWLAGAVGAGLTFAALSNTCAMASVLSKLPYNRGASRDVAAEVARLTAASERQAAS